MLLCAKKCRFVSDGSVQLQGYEINYEAVQCGSDEFLCLNNGQCMPGDIQCNGEKDCDDWSDEDIELCGKITRHHKGAPVGQSKI